MTLCELGIIIVTEREFRVFGSPPSITFLNAVRYNNRFYIIQHTSERIIKMKMTFRWFGENQDPIKLRDIKQIPGMTGVVTSLLDIPAGEVWCED